MHLIARLKENCRRRLVENSPIYVGDARFKTEDEFRTHFETRVTRLRKKLSAIPLGAIPWTEFTRAMFVYRHGDDMIGYYQRRNELTPYRRQQLDIYVDRQYR